MLEIKLKLMVFIFLLLLEAFANQETCPTKCICKGNVPKEGPQGGAYIKMKCGDRILHFDELELLNFASEILQLNLSDNLLKSFAPKVEFIALQKLDLSRNQLSELNANQFYQLPNLRRLDISSNNINHIDLLAFTNLKHLERLKLNQNKITTITYGTFDPLINLKQLDISNNPLICDCGLLWLLEWSQKSFKSTVKLVPNPKCNTPFKDYPLRKLKIGHDIHCKSPAGSSGMPIDLKPNVNQVVFEGDPLTLQCKAPSITDSPLTSGRIEWTWLDADPKLYFNDISIENHNLSSAGLIASTLSIAKLKRNYTGFWNCWFISMQGNHSKGITVVVISDDTKYCPMTVSSNNKGTYNWPRTIVNYTVTTTCESVNRNYNVSQQKASYFCSESGEWQDFNTSMCAYISDNTKILEQFSKVNSSVVESARHFKNFTADLVIFKDTMDLVFAVKTIENYLKFAYVDHVDHILIDVTNRLMDLPRFYLREAQVAERACEKLVNATEALAGVSSSTLLHKSNIALETFPIKKDGFTGMKCTWFVNPANRLDSLFSCATNNKADMSGLQGKSTEASITIPDSLFHQLQDEQDFILTNKAYHLMIAMHSNSKLFPIEQKRKMKEDVTSAVVGVKLKELTVRNLSEPVYVMLRTPPTTAYEVTPFIPVWWDQELNNGTGTWSSEGCKFNHEFEEHIVFSCNNFGYYGLLQDITYLQLSQTGARFKLSHPAIYVGSLILFASLLVVILTYLLCYTTIQMPKKAKHSLINMWIAIALLCFMYVFGIYQTEDVQVCQVVGMILHYFTLCSLLWMCVGVNCMYKRLSKNSDIIGLVDDDLPSDQPIQKPILGLYLVGWGVALIICGLSAAINMKEYASQNHCFLRTGPALSALYIPFTILAVFLSIFFLLIRCAIYNLDANGHLSEGTQATEHVDLDLLEPNNFPIENRSMRSVSTKTASSEIEDPEHAPSAQLKAYMIFLFLYLMTWLSCAFATVPPFHIVTFEEDLFSIAFAILSTTLSAFTLFFYCVARNDVRTQWVQMTRWFKRKHLCFRSRNVSDTMPHIITQIQSPVLPAMQIVPALCDVPIMSTRSSSRTSSHTKSSNILKGAVDLNGSFSDAHAHAHNQAGKINNVNLVVLHRAHYRSNFIPNIIENPTNAAEVFYNPHQSTVARKFFKRQKRNMMKKNNLTTRPMRDINSDTNSVFSEKVKKKSNVDQTNMFGTNSKVNNTNIHVERVMRKTVQRNPNIFSEEEADFDFGKKKESRFNNFRAVNVDKKVEESDDEENNMRSVSQQCTLEYSSENISDSILLDGNVITKPNENQESFMTEVSEAVPSIRRENSPERLEVAPSELDSTPRRIYINPAAHLIAGSESRASSSVASVSDIDELYQQIRRGAPDEMYLNGNGKDLSDSEVTSYASERHLHDEASSHEQFDISDVETTV